MKRVYLDNAATTPIHPQVFDAMVPFLKDNYGNPSSIHWSGTKVRVAVEETREVIAEFINADPSEIYFTSGGTESNNFILNGIAKTEYAESGRKTIISSNIEHMAVIETINNLSSEGFDNLAIETKPDGRIDTAKIKKTVTSDTSLISVMHINNEIGSINNLSEISSNICKQNVWFHTDAVQSFGKYLLDIKQLGVHALTASAHKIYGPKGIGIAYVKSGTPLSSYLFGGSQERNRRGGTENVAGIIGLGEAVRLARKEMQDNFSFVTELKKAFLDGLKNIDNENIELIGHSDSSPYIASITLNSTKYNNDSESMLMFLDINGVAVSSGSACTSGTLKSSHVVKAIGKSEKDAEGTIRFSFGSQNTMDEIEYALEILQRMTKKFRK